MNVASALGRLHRRLLPDDPSIGYQPYLWLMYLLFLLPGLYFIQWDTSAVVLTVLSVIVFLWLYFRGFWLSGNALIYNALLIAMMGALLLPFNASASTYFIYAAAAVGIINNVRFSLIFIIGLACMLLLESWLLDLSLFAMLIPAGFVLMVGFASLFQGIIIRKNNSLRISQAEVSRLATVAERERISRDLHDLLGHSLSLITLKAELAGKLLKRQETQRARQEIDDLERISRTALGEVREAVSGYRQAGLISELQHASEALQSASIQTHLDVASDNLSATHDHTLAMCVREAITNVIRHSEARNCWITLEQDAHNTELSIRDDGKLPTIKLEPGSGLNGMRDRLQMLNGNLSIQQRDGLHLTITLPVDHAETTLENSSLELQQHISDKRALEFHD